MNERNTTPGEFLRHCTEQHKAKNILSKVDDKNAKIAMEAVRLTLDRRFGGILLTNDFDSILTTNPKALEIAKGKVPDSTFDLDPEHGNGIKTFYRKDVLNNFEIGRDIKVKGGINNFIDGGYYITYESAITFQYMIDTIKESGVRDPSSYDIESADADRKIEPDGGVLYLNKIGDESFRKVILISEMKHQGTNDKRVKEGKKRQATGNAIERFGKNLAAIRAFTNYERITPFVLFAWGEDFTNSLTVRSKLVAMNEFYPLNKTYVQKTDGDNNHRTFAPISMYYQKEQWETERLYGLLLDVAETAIRTYLS